jgi:hypothetical protein
MASRLIEHLNIMSNFGLICIQKIDSNSCHAEDEEMEEELSTIPAKNSRGGFIVRTTCLIYS